MAFFVFFNVLGVMMTFNSGKFVYNCDVGEVSEIRLILLDLVGEASPKPSFISLIIISSVKFTSMFIFDGKVLLNKMSSLKNASSLSWFFSFVLKSRLFCVIKSFVLVSITERDS